MAVLYRTRNTAHYKPVGKDIKELNWCQHKRRHDLVNAYNIAVFRLMPDVYCHSQTINKRSKPRTLLFQYLLKSLFRLIGIVGEARLPSNAYFSRTPDYIPFMLASVAQLDAPSDWRPGGRGFNPRRGRQHSFVEIDHEIVSTVILSLPLIQEGQLSVSGERMCTILVNRLED